MEVILIAATTLDGYIARHEHERSFDWTSEEDKRFYIDTIKSSDAIIMGRTSFQTFHRHPRGTNWYIYTSHPSDFTNPNPSVIKAEGTNLPPAELIRQLQAKGAKQVAVCGGKSIYTQFLQSGTVTKIYLTIEPFIFGSGVKLFDKPLPQKLKWQETVPLSPDTIVLKYSLPK
jgi:dihydrofolate reductase